MLSATAVHRGTRVLVGLEGVVDVPHVPAQSVGGPLQRPGEEGQLAAEARLIKESRVAAQQEQVLRERSEGVISSTVQNVPEGCLHRRHILRQEVIFHPHDPCVVEPSDSLILDVAVQDGLPQRFGCTVVIATCAEHPLGRETSGLGRGGGGWLGSRTSTVPPTTHPHEC